MAELTNLICTLTQYKSVAERPSSLKFVRNYSQFLDALVKINDLIGLKDAKYKVFLLVQSFVVNYKLEGIPVHTEKMNVFLCGAPGCGKTLLGQYLAQLFAASGCLPEKTEEIFEIETQKTGGSGGPQAEKREFIINLGLPPPPGPDTEKTELKRRLNGYKTRLAKTDLQILNLLTQFNNVRKKICAKRPEDENLIQAKFQKIKLALKSCVSDDASLTLNALKDLMVTKKIFDSIIPVTVPTLPGRPNTFELRGSSSLLISGGRSSSASLFEDRSIPPPIPASPDFGLANLTSTEKDVEVKFIVVTRGDVIGKYQGHTEEKIRKLFNKYIGGVIMFDEAYSLATDAHDSFGQIVLSEITSFITAHPNKILFIFAGYKQMMHRLLEMQPGLQRRFEITIDIEDYTSQELAQIFVSQVQQLGLDCSQVISEIEKLFKTKKEHFPNYGGSTQLFSNVLKQVIYSDKSLLSSALDDTVSKEDFSNFRKVSPAKLDEAYQLYLQNSVFHTYKEKSENLTYFN